MTDPQAFASGAVVGFTVTVAAIVRLALRMYGTRNVRPSAANH